VTTPYRALASSHRPGEKQEEGKRREKVKVVDVRSLRKGQAEGGKEADVGGRGGRGGRGGGRRQEAAEAAKTDGQKAVLDPVMLAKVLARAEEQEETALFDAGEEDAWRREVRGMPPKEESVEHPGDY